MRYFVGFQVIGEAAEWYENITSEISSTFEIQNPCDVAPPHITVFRPFESYDTEAITNTLRAAAEQSPKHGGFILSDFDHFDMKTMFVRCIPNEEALGATRIIQTELMRIPGMQTPEYDEWHPHLTIANRVPQAIGLNVWTFITKLERKEFSLPLNAVTLFAQNPEGAWVISDVFNF
jgi:2'-5' RNA ligase